MNVVHKQNTLGKKIDELQYIRAKRMEAQKVVEGIQKEERILGDEIMLEMEQLDTFKISGQNATASLQINTVPTVKDWGKVYEWVHNNEAYHLFQRRLSATAFREELENRQGEEIPGIEAFDNKKLHLTTIR